MRHNAAVISVASSLLLTEYQQAARRYPEQAGTYKPRSNLRRLKRENVTFQSVTCELSDLDFKLIYRMRREAFEDLLEVVRGDLDRNEDMGRRSGRKAIQADMRLGVSLRLLAGGQYGDLMQTFHLGRSTVYSIFHSTREALHKNLCMPLLPTTAQGLEKLTEGFKTSRSRANPLTGCIGALDGICFKIEKPLSEMNPALFYSRKGYYAIPAQALVDSQYRFLCVSANSVGSTHDSLAFASSKLGRYLEQGLLNILYWIAGDEAYVCTESLLTPFPSTRLTIYRDSFNCFLSSMRMHVEQAFDMLKAKWRILDNLKFHKLICTSIITLTMKLHNFCIDQKISRNGRFNLTSHQLASIQADTSEWYAIAKEDEMERVRSLRESLEASYKDTCSQKREKLVDLLESKGIVRPNMAFRDHNLQNVMNHAYGHSDCT